MRQILTETMSFRDLLRRSDPARIDRSRHVNARSLQVDTMDGDEAWTFTYKSQGSHSTSGHRWHGYVRFLKEEVSKKASADELDCMVDCDCPDYRYRWAYNNAKAGAGAIGAGAWNDNNGRPPRPREQGGVGDLGEGMCKHLIALGEFLKTKIDPDAPEPKEQPDREEIPKSVQQADPTQAPKPGETYSDSRSGELQESTGKLFESFDKFAKSNPTFEVQYEDDNS